MTSELFVQFWSHVNYSYDNKTCWLWTGPQGAHGYGRFRIRPGTKGRVYAHRWIYEYVVGPIPEGTVVDHVKSRGCTSILCVNPAHLEPVTIGENVLRGDTTSGRNARKTHCNHDHPLSGKNLRITKSGKRECIACVQRRNDERKPGGKRNPSQNPQPGPPKSSPSGPDKS